MLTTTLLALFKEVFSPATLLRWARETGAVQRLRCIQPVHYCMALIDCAVGDEERSIASARRLYGKITGFTPEESSFYERFTNEMLALMERLFCYLLDRISSVQRDVLAAALGGTSIIDILAVDATQGLLPAAAADVMPSTDERHGGFKLTAVLSLMFQRLQEVVITDARTHDRKALTLPRWLHGLLYIFDRGYSDHRLFAAIADRMGFFLTRLKGSTTAVITNVRCGLGQAHIGQRLTDELPLRGVVDVDVKLSVRGGRSRVFRAIRVLVDGPYKNGRRERIAIWLVTNLIPEDFNAEQVATLYRLRWEVEVLFHTMKAVGRLDQLRSASVVVIRAFIYATLIGMLLAHEVCAQMRREWPDREPSPYRVAALVLGWLPKIASVLRSPRAEEVIADFVHTLRREGVNPNPGRPYAAQLYSRQICDFSR